MDLLIENARVIDPESGSVIDRGFVAIEGARIRAVDAGTYGGPAAARIDARGATLLPGLIDAHVHFASFADAPDQIARGVTDHTIAEATLRGAASARRMIESGVTTVRDLGCPHVGIFALRESIAKGETLGPRIVAAGAAITPSGGPSYLTCAVQADGPDEIRRRVREQARAGAEVIKVFISPSVLHRHRTATARGVLYDESEVRAAVDAAHALGQPVAAHACTEEAITAAVVGGIDAIEHGHEITEPTAEEMARRGTWYVPTVWHYRKVALNREDFGFDSETIERAKVYSERQGESFRRAMAAGVQIAAGTDSGGPRYHSGSFHLELAYMAELGMPPMQVLRSATTMAARCLRLEDGTGRLIPGTPADIALFRGDPLASLLDLTAPVLVVKGGQPVAGPLVRATAVTASDGVRA